MTTSPLTLALRLHSPIKALAAKQAWDSVFQESRLTQAWIINRKNSYLWVEGYSLIFFPFSFYALYVLQSHIYFFC